MEEALAPEYTFGFSSGPWSSGELNTLIGDYGKRLISSPPEGRGTVLMELTEKWFDLHVRGCYDGLQTEVDRSDFLCRLDNNLPMWFRHSLAPILSKSDKQTAERCLNVMLSTWRGKACSTAIVPVEQTASETDQVGQCEQSWAAIEILFETDVSVQIARQFTVMLKGPRSKALARARPNSADFVAQ
jgi:hypothetical protein